MFAVIVNGKMKIANIAYKMITKYMPVVQTSFSIKGQTGDFGYVFIFRGVICLKSIRIAVNHYVKLLRYVVTLRFVNAEKLNSLSV